MSQNRSLTSLPQVTYTLLCALATWGLVNAVGEGDEIRYATDNGIYFLTLIGVATASICFFLHTWFVPSEFAANVTSTFRSLRIILSISVLVLSIAVFGLLNLFLIVLGLEFETTLLIWAVMGCFYLAKCGFGLACLTVLIGGGLGIAIDLKVLASRIRLPKANFR